MTPLMSSINAELDCYGSGREEQFVIDRPCGNSIASAVAQNRRTAITEPEESTAALMELFH